MKVRPTHFTRFQHVTVTQRFAPGTLQYILQYYDALNAAWHTKVIAIQGKAFRLQSEYAHFDLPRPQVIDMRV